MFSNNLLMAAAGGGDAGYVIEGSGLFGDATGNYLSRAFSSGDNNTYTIELIFKRTTPGAIQFYFSAGGQGAGSTQNLYIDAADALIWEGYDGGYDIRLSTTQKFRDPNAWYHLILFYDDTPATPGSSDCGMILNGVQITDFGTEAYPSQNQGAHWNTAITHYIGANATWPMGAPIARFTNIDGQKLDATSFGEFDSNGYWQLNDSSGLTFGAEGFLIEGGTNVANGVDSNSALTVTLEGPSDAAFADEGSNYSFVGRSVSSDIVNKATRVESAHNFAADFTVAFQPGPDATDGGHLVVGVYDIAEDGTYSVDDQTGAMSSMTASWWCERDGDVKYGSSNKDTGSFGADDTIKLKRSGSTLTWYKNDVLYHEHTDTSSATLRLVIAAGATGITHRSLRWWDSVESEGNFFTPTGTITATNDSPTNDAENGYGNYNTFDPNSDIYDNGTFSNGNLNYVSSTANYSFVMGTLGMMSGVWYWEVEKDAGGVESIIGVTNIISAGTTNSLGNDAGMVAYIGSDTGWVKSEGAIVSSGDGAIGNGDIVSIRLDLDAGTPTIKFYKNDGLLYSHNLSATQDPAQTGKPLFAAVGDVDLANGTTFKSDFGQLGFTYSLPADHSALHTANMPTPTIPDPEEHHQVELVNHDGTSTAGTCSFDLDDYEWLCIIKNRDNIENWYTINSLVGVDEIMHINVSDVEATDANVLTVSGTTYTLGSTLLADNYIVEFHKAGLAAATASDEAGSINTTSTSFNATSGFFMSLYTGTGANATVGTGLSTPVEFLVSKCRNDNTGAGEGHWHSYHIGTASDAETDYMRLNTTAGAVDDATAWQDTVPGNEVFSIGTYAGVNVSSNLYFSFGWYSVPGYSAFGSYEGNSSTDGCMINVGLKPASIVLKSIDSTSSWHVYHDNREGYNVDNDRLNFETTAAEGTADEVDLLSNGVKLRIATDPNIAETYTYSMWGGTPIQGPAPSTSTSQGRAR